MFGSHYVGGYSGVSFRVAKGVRFNLGGVRGHRVSEREVVAVSRGQLSFTSGRILFLGQRKAFEVPWSKLMAVEPYFDGIQLFTRNRQRSPLMVYRDPEMSELAAMICSHYLN